MSEFHGVINEFDSLITDYGFKCPQKLWYNNLIALCKHIDDIYYCYVIARVYKHDGSLETTFWVGPIDRPDDGLESLSAHIKVQIGYNQTLDENFFVECENKIINLIKGGNLVSLLATSKKELENPSVVNRRYEVYTKYFLPFFKKVIIESNNDKKLLKNKKKCMLVIEKTFSSLDGEMKIFFKKFGFEATAVTIWNFCYIYSL
jgi:hypothetical protein